MRNLRDPQRLWDIVRFMRSELLQKELITTDEYSDLARDHAAVHRLEQDDADRGRRRTYEREISAADF